MIQFLTSTGSLFESGKHQTLSGCPQGADALLINDLCQSHGLVVHIARDHSCYQAMEDALSFINPALDIIRFPAWDCLPYDRLSPTQGVVAERMLGLSRLAGLLSKPKGAPVLVLTQTQAITQRTPPVSWVRAGTLTLMPGQTHDITGLEAYFQSAGYQRVSTVSERGEFAVRGGLIDVFSPDLSEPVRLDFFGDTLESIRSFDTLSQRSLKQIAQIEFLHVNELSLDQKSISRFRQAYHSRFGVLADEPYYVAATNGMTKQGLEQLLPLFHDQLDSLFDFLPKDAVLAFDALAHKALEAFLMGLDDTYEQKKLHTSKSPILNPKELYLTQDQFVTKTSSFKTCDLEAFDTTVVHAKDMGARIGRNFASERLNDSVNLFSLVSQYAKEQAKSGRRVLFASWTAGASDRLGTMLSDHGLGAIRLAGNLADALGYGVAGTKVKPIQRCVFPIEHGFSTQDLVVISETDILGDRLARPKKQRKAKNFLSEASALSPGDFVVHIEHGIARYAGLTVLNVNDAPHDCLELHYANDAKLFLPVENIDLLTRYGSDSDEATLDRLGSSAWQSRKARAKQRLRDMADGLIALAAARALKSGAQIDPPSGLYDEFCAQFPYDETDDQLSAIADVLEDLAKGQPMDRLICGDVGFGKTEVALRAAFVVAMSGQQVAIICPTTLLARQHFKTFSQRFKGWPIRVRHLSRLVSAKEANETRQGLEKGEVEVVIGTHALLSDKLKFLDLGIVIVDEEQHFGVKHKEHLKAMRTDVHVLSLSATPIPRTLQMALSGIRDMSIIATPPVDRMAIRTYVLGYDPTTIREALLREKYRGGQAYYVVPRIADLAKITDFLRDHVPEIRFVVGHGQLSPAALEDVMTAFYEGQYDVLVSTTIVESGLDVPTANTMIIHRAEMFGLSQLYQIRGRIGRAKTRAYAYLTTDAHKPLSDTSEKRLKILQSLDNLGAGFQLASHDLDIRGGGNLLGNEQSGHIREIGVELYQQMLEDCVNELQQNRSDVGEERSWSPLINIGVAVLIPETYISDLAIRLSIYRRVSDAQGQDAREALAAELIDRFGPIPQEAEQLLKVMAIKAHCKSANISKLDLGPKGAVVSFRRDEFNNPMGLIAHIQKRPNDWKIRPDQKLLVRGDWPEATDRMEAAGLISSQLAQIAIEA